MDIYVIETAGADYAQVEKYLTLVGSSRRDAVKRKLSEEAKLQSLIAGLLVRSEIAYRLGVDMKKVAFCKGAHGKPYVRGGGVQFSLSHTEGAVCAAFAEDNGDIGVDIERRDRKVSERLKQRTLSENENALVDSDDDFIKLWVKKEAFLKRTGLGIAQGLRGADTTILPDISVYSCGGYYIGISGKGADEANIIHLSLDGLLSRFTEQ